MLLLPVPKPVLSVPDEIEPFEYRLRVPNDARAVPIARGATRAFLAAHGLGELTGRAELLACELLTNAIVHTTDAGRAARLLVAVGGPDADRVGQR
ncbi:hypothetical protein ABZ752_06645 [Streptomyces roseifaciens]